MVQCNHHKTKTKKIYPMPLFGGAHFALCAPSGVLYVFFNRYINNSTKNSYCQEKNKKKSYFIKKQQKENKNFAYFGHNF